MRTPVRERRAHPRYPIPVPIRFRLVGERDETRSRSGDLSAGGLSFRSPRPIPEGAEVEVAFPLEGTPFHLHGLIARCAQDETPGSFRIGVAFRSPEQRFRQKLAEQVLRIHELRRELTQLREVEVSTEEAAREWVARYAREFAELYEG